MSTEVGHHEYQVYVSQDDGKLIVPTSAYVDVESGGEIQLESGARILAKAGSTVLIQGNLKIGAGGSLEMSTDSHMRMPTVFTTSTDVATPVLSPSGVNILGFAKNSAMTFRVGVPQPGDECTIILATSATKALKIKVCEGSTAYTPKFADKDCVIAFTSDLGASVMARSTFMHSCAIRMHAVSTAKWYVSQVPESTWAHGKLYAVSTTT